MRGLRKTSLDRRSRRSSRWIQGGAHSPSGYRVTKNIADIQISLHSVLKEFAEPLRTNDSRTDFFATYRRESAEFDRDYAKKYDEDLNTSLIIVSRIIYTLRTGH